MRNTFKVKKVETREYEAIQFRLDNKEELEQLLSDKGYSVKYKRKDTDLYEGIVDIPEEFKLEEHCCVLRKGQTIIFLIDRDYLILNDEYICDVVTEEGFNTKYNKIK